MQKDQLKSLLSLCGGNNSSVQDLNVKVDPQSRALRIDTIKPGDITQYLRTPKPEYTPPSTKPVTPEPEPARQEMIKQDFPTKGSDDADVPMVAVEPKIYNPVNTGNHEVNDEAYNTMVRIAMALERIADVLDARFRHTESYDEKIQVNEVSNADV